ncbi:ImcF-related family protein [Mangrovibacter plantisponsor]|uniref:Type VI secretion system protein ImpL n=1 Tax=Mangrovibacter plantisponsor TaxID=451513 RepID=A0A317PTC7_9ENTR|nr:ImcF-related family protein [Mangrovibacter plantisponsor]PWW04913.1 type VI secretion system protein ImpL [Mangrovibacter plantisponsor]
MGKITKWFKENNRLYWFVVISALLAGSILYYIVLFYSAWLGVIRDTPSWHSWESNVRVSIIIFSVVSILMFIIFYKRGKDDFLSERNNTPGDDIAIAINEKSADTSCSINVEICDYLRNRSGPFWRRKVRLLLITGDDGAVSRLVPGLKENQWLECNGTVLIYGGNLDSRPDAEKLNALRKLRRFRPLDAIIRVLDTTQSLTPLRSDTDLRSLEKISEILRYSPPVWLWQLCASAWPQEGREPQAVGITLPRNAMPDDVEAQLNALLPQLRQQGLSQVGSNWSYDFLLRLAWQLGQGGSAQWKAQLIPWLQGASSRISLRGVMFSQPEPVAKNGGKETTPMHPHALVLPPTWQGVLNGCARVRGFRVGRPWEPVLAWSLAALCAVWFTGLLISATVNYYHISTVAARAHALDVNPPVSDAQLTALHALRNDAGRLQYHIRQRAPLYWRFGLDHSQPLLDALLPYYGRANNHLIRDPASQALAQSLRTLVNTPPDSSQRAALAKSGYDQLKAWLMMSQPERVDAAFFTEVMASVQPAQPGLSQGLWQALAPDLWAFWMDLLPSQPGWAITPDNALVTWSRQVLLQQVGQRNAESNLYNGILLAVRRNVADVTLEDMTNGTEVGRLFSTREVVPGMFTRQAWENSVAQAIDSAANARREEIDWVLSDGRNSVSADISPEALKTRLTQRYFTDFAGAWLNFLNSLQLTPANTIADVTDQLTLISDVRQSPVIALMNTLAWQGQTGRQGEGLAGMLLRPVKNLASGPQPVIDQLAAEPQGPLDDTFGPLLALAGISGGTGVISADSSLSLQTWLTRITRVRLRLQQVAAAPDPQEMMQSLAQTVFQGKSVDLTDTRQYGSLMAASLGEEWSGFGRTVFVEPLTRAWEAVLHPSAISLNGHWKRSVVADWQTAFGGRYPLADSKSEVSLPMLAEFIRADNGRIDRFLSTQLGGVLHKEGSRWVPDSANSQGLTFDPAFLEAVNQLSQLAEILFTDGQQGIRFELQARPAPEVVETRLTIDGQQLHYFNQMADWHTFRWPGETYQPGLMLTWASTRAGTRLFGDYTGTWGLVRWLEQGTSKPLSRSEWMMSFTAPDGRELEWVLRSQLGKGPLALLALRGFRLPEKIFIVEPHISSPNAPVASNSVVMQGTEE